ncbi:MAG: hypothetical protein GWO20_00580 [Candidatus Korarchaeota archaeon]|nr:hypothetical protein [Candidatus Korarchaeota archaeon]NIU82076.1 hypothetical protein [Candidatus Thorarchaeota archaeon]NIW12496.1 hypothetical protein [Candidatus Thorarchaeota archaeon]NIW50710.1 hypothetical protein [Candidatus Korarchaeota archaeon]
MPESFTERGVGKHLLPYLRRAKRKLYVCSPDLSEKYTILLKKKAEEGVKVKLITSAPNKKALDVIAKKEGRSDEGRGGITRARLKLYIAFVLLPVWLVGFLDYVGVPPNLSYNFYSYYCNRTPNLLYV